MERIQCHLLFVAVYRARDMAEVVIHLYFPTYIKFKEQQRNTRYYYKCISSLLSEYLCLSQRESCTLERKKKITRQKTNIYL